MDITIDNKVEDFNFSQSEAEEIIKDSLAKLGQGSNIEIELIFVKAAEIQKLNQSFRRIDKPTDVLSFPQEQFQTDHNILGSIVICPKVAEERGEPIAELIKHGLLHLVGYDHEINDAEWLVAAKKIDSHF